MSAVTRWLGGEEIAFVDLVEVLFDLPVTETPADDVQRAHALLDEVLPPGGSLRDRLAVHDDATRVAPDLCWRRLHSWLIACASATRQDLGLPDGESIELAAVRDRPWGASARYCGDLRTRIELNLELPATLGLVTYLAAHESYPGHHAERATKEIALWRERDLGEAAVACLYSPRSRSAKAWPTWRATWWSASRSWRRGCASSWTELALAIPAEVVERELAVERARVLLRNLTADAALALRQRAAGRRTCAPCWRRGSARRCADRPRPARSAAPLERRLPVQLHHQPDHRAVAGGVRADRRLRTPAARAALARAVAGGARGAAGALPGLTGSRPMDARHVDVLLVGGGVASVRCARTLRRQGSAAPSCWSATRVAAVQPPAAFQGAASRGPVRRADLARSR